LSLTIRIGKLVQEKRRKKRQRAPSADTRPFSLVSQRNTASGKIPGRLGRGERGMRANDLIGQALPCLTAHVSPALGPPLAPKEPPPRPSTPVARSRKVAVGQRIQSSVFLRPPAEDRRFPFSNYCFPHKHRHKHHTQRIFRVGYSRVNIRHRDSTPLTASRGFCEPKRPDRRPAE
jgi:hypothetical protein